MVVRKKIIIDGYNLIKANPAIFSKMSTLELQRMHLLKLLSSAPILQGHEVTVVFDGQSDSQQTRLQKKNWIRIIFSGKDLEADEVVQKLIRQQATREKLEIVSSDRKIQRTASDHQVMTISSQEFWKMLQPHPAKVVKSPDDEINPEQNLSKKELQEWLKIFRHRQNSVDKD